MKQGFYPRQYGPSYVYIKYRCSRCKKLGEHFVKQEEWEDGLLKDNLTELTPEEKSRFDALGQITYTELAEVHRQLDGLEKLPDRLLEE